MIYKKCSFTKQQLLPESLVSHFMKCLCTHQLLIRLHNFCKKTINNYTVHNYNVSAFLTLDKSRKIIRLKQDEFVWDLIKKIQRSHALFIGQNLQIHNLFTIPASQLQKFLQIYQIRRNKFNGFRHLIKNLISFELKDPKCQLKINESINKMSSFIQKIQQKICFICKKYDQKYSMNLSQKIILLDKYQLNIEPYTPNHIADNKEKEKPNQRLQNQKKQQKGQKQQKSIYKIGQNSLSQQKMMQYKKQIAKLKSKYYELNCKTQNFNQMQIKTLYRTRNKTIGRQSHQNNYFSQQNQKSLIETQSQLKNDLQTAPSDMKYSIRLTTSKKNSSFKQGLSIFQKSNHNSSFFKSSNSNFYQKNATYKSNVQSNKIEQNKIKKGSFLRKNSAISKKNSKIMQQYIIKKPNNSVYRQTNFYEQNMRRKSSKKSVETNNKNRNSSFRQQDKKQCFLRTSQTEGNIYQQTINEQQINFSQSIIANLNETQSNIKQLNSNNLQEQQIQQINTLKDYKKGTKKNNRRKGFSKKHIQQPNDQLNEDNNDNPNDSRRNSGWKENQKKQRGYNRTSFFRSSGYLNKKTVQKIGKTKFYNLNRKRKEQNKQTHFSQKNIETGTRKTIRTKFLEPKNNQSKIKASQFAINFKQFIQLNQSINKIAKIDENNQYPDYLLDLMRMKYDLNFKKHQNQQNFQQYQSRYLRPKLKIIQNQSNYRQRNRNIIFQDKEMFDMSRKAVRTFNQLGQKELSIQKYNYQYPDLQTFV